jgi:hypothetical protein
MISPNNDHTTYIRQPRQAKEISLTRNKLNERIDIKTLILEKTGKKFVIYWSARIKNII